MKEFVLNMFSETSTVSWMRVVGAIAFIFALFLIIADIPIEKDLSNMWMTLLTFSVGGKLIQKFGEK